MRFHRIILPALSLLLLISCAEDIDMSSRDGGDVISTVVAAGTGPELLLAEPSATVTRATDPDLQNTALDSRTRLGVFVVRPEVWAEIVRASSQDDYAAAFCDKPLDGYGYMNVPCRAYRGNIVPEDGSSFRLPGDEQFDRLGVAVVVYAPYKANLTLRSLLRRHEGTVLRPLKDQREETDELNSDIIYGIPAEGNPVWRLVSGSVTDTDGSGTETEREATEITHGYNVALSLRHYGTRLTVETVLHNTSETDTLRYDSISVCVVDPVRIYKYGPYISPDAQELVFPDNVSAVHLNTDDIQMATWRNITLLPGQSAGTYYATCMVLPIQLHLSTAFQFTFYRDGQVLDTRIGGPDRDVKYQSGKSLRFPVNIRL